MYDVSKNSLIQISLTALFLGLLIGTSVTFLVLQGGSYSDFYLYLIVLCVYFFNEFDATARYQTSILNAHLFLIWGNRGNTEFMSFQVMTIVEWASRKRYGHMILRLIPVAKTVSYVRCGICLTCIQRLGFFVSVCGILLRRQAMKTCGDSFSHYIETSARNQKLITHGIYKYVRHPSYLGFWLFVTGLQIFLGNIISLVISIVVLSTFFRRRIEFEEWHLVHKIFGLHYIRYRERTRHWIPFVNVQRDLSA